MQAISTARHRIDSCMPGLMGAEEALRAAREDWRNRVGFRLVKSHEISRFSQGGAATEQGQQHLPHVPPCLHVRCAHHCHHHHGPRHDPPLDVRRSSSRLLNMFSKKAPAPLIPPSVAVPAHTRQMAAAAVLLEEWLQELAALAQEHSVLLQQEKILGNEERILDNELVTEST